MHINKDNNRQTIDSNDPSASTLIALESAVALPNVFTKDEMKRTLRRNQYDVMKTALQLREKHIFRQTNLLENLNISQVKIELRKKYIQLVEDAYDKLHCPILLFTPRLFKPKFSSDLTTSIRDKGTIDGTTSMEEARKVFIYLIDLAIEIMEDEKAPGITYLIDMNHCTIKNFDTNVLIELLSTLKKRYPETVHNIFILNTTPLTRGLSNIYSNLLSEKTKNKIHILPDDKIKIYDTLQYYIDSKYIPIEFKGKFVLPDIDKWIISQAELEGVDLNNKKITKKEKEYISNEASDLNGMQYAGCSAKQVIEMQTSPIQGQIWQKHGDTSSGVTSNLNIFGIGWLKRFAILRPDALLLYDNIKSLRPEIIIPIKDSNIKSSQFPNEPRGTFGMLLTVPMTTHMLCAFSEQDRSRWLQEIQLASNHLKDKINKERIEMDIKCIKEDEFLKLDMISFDNPPKLNQNNHFNNSNIILNQDKINNTIFYNDTLQSIPIQNQNSILNGSFMGNTINQQQQQQQQQQLLQQKLQLQQQQEPNYGQNIQNNINFQQIPMSIPYANQVYPILQNQQQYINPLVTNQINYPSSSISISNVPNPIQQIPQYNTNLPTYQQNIQLNHLQQNSFQDKRLDYSKQFNIPQQNGYYQQNMMYPNQQ